MCGIAGLIDPALAAGEIRDVLQRMTDAIVHRGPDDEGAFAVDGVGIGMRRLSIIDVAGGHQPIGTEDGLVQVVFNGEIYNYPELQAGLKQRGHRFCTNSDTEVIAHLYEERGADCLTDLCGMFGIAVWDESKKRLFLARDRLGKKPLFYAHRDGRLLFGSEIKAILAADPTLAQPDPEALGSYFRYGFVPEPGTMFRHIRKLPAAHWMVYEAGQIRMEPYWRVEFGEPEELEKKPQRWVEELDALLLEAVRSRLMSEVPLGVFLSGGLDSSAVVSYAHRAGLEPIRSFTIGFDREEWDESGDAQVVADHFGTDHRVLALREQDLSRNLPETLLALVRHFDEPFGDSSALPTYHVSKLAREHVTVILSGDGGDELFSGYSSNRGIRFAEMYRRLPQWVGKRLLPALAQAGAGCLPRGKRYGAQRAAKILRDSSLPFETMYFQKHTLCAEPLLRSLLSADFLEQHPLDGDPGCPQDILEVMRSDLPVLSKAGYADLRFRLLEDMLVKVDRMSMAHSLEVRSPFLDHRLVEFAARIPPELKMRGWETKAILRDAVKSSLPDRTIRKGKRGFSVPLREWLRTGLSEMVGDYLEADGGRLPEDLFNPSGVRELIAQHRKGEADHSSVIWLLLNYAAWHEMYSSVSL